MPLTTALLLLFEGPVTDNLKVLGTVPSDRTWLVRELVFQNGAGAAVDGQVLIRRGGIRVPVLEVLAVPSGGVRTASGRFTVLPPGTEVLAYAAPGVNPVARIALFGARLTGIAPA